MDDYSEILEKWKKPIENLSSEFCNLDIQIIKQLLEHPKKGEFINWKDSSITKGMTMIGCAAYYRRLDIVKLLVEHGANINSADNSGWTVLMYAAARRFPEIVEFLLEHGANTEMTERDGYKAFDMANRAGYSEIVDLFRLKELEANPNDSNGKGQTYLHWACLQNKKTVAQRVLELGTDKDRIDHNGHTALFYAAQNGFADIVELLMSHNVDANKTDVRRLRNNKQGRSFYSVKDGRTSLFIAAQNGHRNVVALLLKYGADPYLCDHKSRIPRDVSGAHSAIQQLFRIQDFFDKRELGDGYKTTYITCEQRRHHSSIKEKKPVPPLEDIIHDIVQYSHFADKFLELYRENERIVNFLDGSRFQEVACKECREIILMLGDCARYELEDNKPAYENSTCKIYYALDYWGLDEDFEQPRRVAFKFMEEKGNFENENREEDDDSLPNPVAYRAYQLPEYAEACRTWTTGESDRHIVLERGERSLLEVMDVPNEQ